MDRRQVLKGAMTGALTLWASPLLRAAPQASAAAGVKKVTNRVSVIDAGTNVVVLSGGDQPQHTELAWAQTLTAMTCSEFASELREKQTVFGFHTCTWMCAKDGRTLVQKKGPKTVGASAP